MRQLLICLIVLSVCLYEMKAFDLIEGSSYNNKLAHQQKVEYNAIPLWQRTKDYFYNDPAQNQIKAIVARDIDRSQTNVRITAGGIGFSYVNLRFEGERGSGINYNVEIYT